MKTPLGDPDDLHNAAKALRSEASRLGELHSQLTQAAQFWWIGPKADRFRSEIQAHNNQLNRAATECIALASRCDTAAAKVEKEIAAVLAAERRVRVFIEDAIRINPLFTFSHGGWSRHVLPGYCSPDWLILALHLGV